MNNKRKNRGGPIRTQRTRSLVTVEGVYNNAHFMHAATAQVGNIVRLKTASGAVWEGIFKTFSSAFDVVLELAAKVDNPDSTNPALLAGTLVDKLVFKSRDVLAITARDVDLDYAIRDTFQTDTAITAARLNGAPSRSVEEKELEPWDATMEANGSIGGGLGGVGACVIGDTSLELDNAANGWDANDMFKKNELEYGVTSSYDHSLRGYTVPLNQCDSADYKEAEAKANLIASEIESQPQHKARLELENGDEESTFAAVVRPSDSASSSNGKYIPPAKRKNQNTGKIIRSTPPPQPPPQSSGSSSSANSSAQTTPSPKAINPPPMTYPTHPSPHSGNSNNSSVNIMHNAHAPPPPQNVHIVQQQHVIQQQQQQPPPQQQMHQVQQVVQQQQQGNVISPQQQPQQIQHHPNRPHHSHTPPHHYNSHVRQISGGPPIPQKQHINGESKSMQHQRGSGIPRNVYQGPPPPQNIPPSHQQQQQQQPPQQQQYQTQIDQQPVQHQPPPQQPQQLHMSLPLSQEIPHRQHHRDDKVKELHVFSQEFQLAPKEHQQQPPQMQMSQAVIMEQQIQQQMAPQVPPPNKPSPRATPPQPSMSPPQDNIDKVSSTLKKSNLNPNAKEFVLNPTAKPFQPSFSRSPSTSSASRPHTPQTPSHSPYITQVNGPMGQPPTSVMMPVAYMVQNQPQYQQQQQGNRIRKIPMGQMRTDVASQMQVAAATGQPLLAPAPIQPFVYQTGLNHQAYPVHAVRMYEAGPHQLQYIPQNPAQAQSPAQAPQYQQSQNPQAPPQQYQAQAQGQPQFPLAMCNIIPAQPHMMQSMQYLPQHPQQHPQHQHPILLNLQHQHPQAQHGPA